AGVRRALLVQDQHQPALLDRHHPCPPDPAERTRPGLRPGQVPAGQDREEAALNRLPAGLCVAGSPRSCPGRVSTARTPGRLSCSSNEPPCSDATALTSVRPRPLPGAVRASSSRPNLRNASL